jgi:hypothetical protein
MGRPLVTDEQVRTFATDGVVCLRGAFGPEWIEPLRRGIQKNIAEPSDRARFWDRDAEGRTCFFDNQSWLHIDEYRDFAVGSPAAEVAGQPVPHAVPPGRAVLVGRGVRHVLYLDAAGAGCTGEFP